jgi:uncharacterized protein YcbK (DUF882 family)
MTIQSSLLGGAVAASDANRAAAEARPLALQHEDPSSPDFTSLLNAAMRPDGDRERPGAALERSRRGDRARAESSRASERSTERAERASNAASDRADALRYDMLNERRAETRSASDAGRVREARSADAERDAAVSEATGAPPRDQDDAERVDAVDQSTAPGTEGTPRVAEPAADAAAQAAAQASAPTAADAERLAAAALAAAASDPTRVVRDPNTLAPELRERLGRVVARMRDEFGHDVQLVEAARTPQRQDYLYEQGRTREGAVVTWTHNSKHLDGRAADVMIDGGYRNAAAFERLQQVAAEEGLGTLGARDPGHLELAGKLARGPIDAAAAQQAMAAVQRLATVEQVSIAQPAGAVAEVARVAGVAGVAEVAQVAEVARVGGEPAASVAAPATMAANAGRGGAEGESDRSDRRARSMEAPTRRKAARAEEGADALASVRPNVGERVAQPTAVEAPAPAVPVDAASRISRVLELQDVASIARPMSHMTLKLDNAMGGEDRIRVDLRGLGVGTHIDVTDAGAADRMQSRVGELQRALEGHGLESDGVRIGVRRPEPDRRRPERRGGDRRCARAGAPERRRVRVVVVAPAARIAAPHPEDERRQPAHEWDETGQHAGESGHRSRKEHNGDRKR